MRIVQDLGGDAFDDFTETRDRHQAWASDLGHQHRAVQIIRRTAI